MIKTIVNEHIPRTIFGVKYNVHKYDTITLNCTKRFDTHKEALSEIAELEKYPMLYKDIKVIKWIIRDEDAE
jgi:hypothetical protein